MPGELAAGGVVRFGDSIALNSFFGGLLHGNGLASDELGILRPGHTGELSGCLWSICVQRQYTAQMQFAERLDKQASQTTRRSKTSRRRLSVVGRDKEIDSLAAAASKEKRMNAEQTATSLNTTVHYGNIVQIQHIKSKKFLTATSTVAMTNKEGFVLSLTEGSENSWFRVVPYFKLRSSGQVIYYDDQLSFQSVLMTGCALTSASDQDSPRRSVGGLSERPKALSSLSAPVPLPGLETPLSPLPPLQVSSTGEFPPILPRTPTLKSPSSAPLRPGSYELLEASLSADRTSSAWRLALMSRGQDLSSENHIQFNDVVRLHHAQSDAFLSGPMPSVAQMLPDLAASLHLAAPPPGMRDTYMKPRVSGQDNDANNAASLTHAKSLWRIEPLGIANNGARLTWSSRFRLRHLLSAQLLSFDKASAQGTGARACFTTDLTPTTEFTFLPTTKVDQQYPLLWTDAAKLFNPSTGKVVTCQANPRDSTSSDLIDESRTYSVDSLDTEEDSAGFLIQKVQDEQREAAEALLSLNHVLGNFITKFVRRTPDADIAKSDVETVIPALEKAIFFLTKTLDPRALQCKGIPIVLHQDFARETRLIDMVFTALSVPAFAGTTSDEWSLVEIIRLLYKLVRHCFQDHRVNETYVAKHGWTKLIMTHLEIDVGAEVALTQLLSNNLQLLEVYVDSKFVQFLVGLIEKNGRKAVYLHFLTALCSCLGRNISTNQEDILIQLIKNRPKLLARFAPNPLADRQPWGSLSEKAGKINLSDDPGAFRGSDVYRNGLHRINVSWDDLGDNFGVADLFPNESGDSVALEKLFEIRAQTEGVSITKTAEMEHQEAFAEYVDSQILLFSEMCRGRSANCIEAIEKLMPFDVLLSSVKNPELPYSLRASMLELLMALYVDRAPLQPVLVPQKFRNLRDDVVVAIASNSNPADLRLLEDFASDMMLETAGQQDIAQTERNSFTLAVLKLITYMLEYGFYATVGEIHDLIVPLIDTLDGRQDFNSEEIEDADGPTCSYTQPLPCLAAVREVLVVKKDTSEAEFPARCKSDEHSIIVIKCKLQMLKILIALGAYAVDFRISSVMQVVKRVFDRHKKSLFGTGNFPRGVMGGNKAKVIPADAAGRLSVAVNGANGTFSPLPRKLRSDDIETTMKSESSKALDLDYVTPDTSMLDVLLDLLMYDHDELKDLVLKLVVSQSLQRHALLDELSSVNLLMSDRDVVASKEIEEKLARVKNLFENFEVWGKANEFSDFDENSFKECLKTVQLLRGYCWEPSGESTAVLVRKEWENFIPGIRNLCPDTKENPLPSWQNFMALNGAIDILVDGMQRIQSQKGSLPPNSRLLLSACHDTVRAILRHNPLTQAMALVHLPEFLDHISLDIGAPMTIYAMYEGNATLCARISPTFASRICSNIFNAKGVNYDFFGLLRVIMVASNKQMLQRLMVDTCSQYLNFCVDGTSRAYMERVRWVEATRLTGPASQTDSVKALRRKLQDHCAILTLMSDFTSGYNHVTEALANKYYPPPAIMAAVVDPRNDGVLRIFLLRYLAEACLVAESNYPHLSHLDVTWKMLGFFSEYINSKAWEPNERTSHEVEFVFDGILVAAKAFFSHYYVSSEATFPQTKIANVLLESLRRTTPCATNLSDLERLEDCIGSMESVLTTKRDSLAGNLKASLSVSAKPVLEGEEAKESPGELFDVYREHFESSIADLKSESNTQMQSSLRHELKAISDWILTRKSGCFTPQLVLRNIVKRITSTVEEVATVDLVPKEYVCYMKMFQVQLEEARKLPHSNTYEALQRTYITAGVHSLVVNVFGALKGKLCTLTRAALSLGSALLDRGVFSEVQSAFLKDWKTTSQSFLPAIQIALRDCCRKLNAKALIQQFRASKNVNKKQAGTYERIMMENSGVNLDLVEGDLKAVLTFLQYMTEGHKLDVQLFLGSQSIAGSKYASVTILSEVVTCLVSALKLEAKGCSGLIIQILQTLTEFVQGPCSVNQDHLNGTSLIVTISAILSNPFLSLLSTPLTIYKIKGSATALLLAMLEWRKDRDIHDQIESIIGTSMLEQQLKVTHEDILRYEKSPQTHDELISASSELSGYYYTLLRLLHPGETGLVNNVGTDIASIEERMGAVEILWGDRLERVFYRKRALAQLLDNSLRTWVVWNVDRSSAEGKCASLVEFTDTVYRSLAHNQRLTIIPFYEHIKRFKEAIQQAMLWMAVFLNFSLIISVKRVNGEITYMQPGGLFERVTAVFSVVNLVFALIACIHTYATLGYLKAEAFYTSWNLSLAPRWAGRLQEGRNGFCEYMCMITAASVLYFATLVVFITERGSFLLLGYVCVSYASLNGSVWLYPFLLLDVVNRSKTIEDVLRAVTTPAGQLVSTMVLVLIFLLIFTTYGFYFYPDEYSDQDCETLFVCLVLNMDQGLRYGGGIGEYWPNLPQYGSSAIWLDMAIYNLLFFIIITVILLNVVFGVIIDTFGALREEHNFKVNDMRTNCFICSLPIETLEQDGSVFTHHIKNEHSMWEYVNFIIYLRAKDPTEYSGAEQYVAAMLKRGDTSWFPIRRALCLQGDQGKKQKAEELYSILASTAQAQDRAIAKLSRQVEALTALLTTTIADTTAGRK